MEAAYGKRGSVGVAGAMAWILVAAVGLRVACSLAAPGLQAVTGLSQGASAAIALAGLSAFLATLASGRD